MSSELFATAHEAWEQNWRRPEEHARWLGPEPKVQALVPLLHQRGFSRVLDLGCGLGRHAQYLASQGFSCAGIDASEAGLEYARAQAKEARLDIDYRVGPFYTLPFGDGSFAAVIAWNVIYHGDRQIAQRAIAEIARVLVPGGLYVGTMLSRRDSGYGVGREVQPDTFVVDGATDDKRHPHMYVSGLDVLVLHRGFEVLAMEDVEQGPGHHHWQFTFERVAGR